MTQSISKNIHPDSLTGVRGIAAIWVALFHYWNEMGGGEITLSLFGQALTLTPLLSRGYLGVDIFFILSGFVLTLAYVDRLRFDSPREFYARYRAFLGQRVLRVIPAYYVHLLFLILTAALLNGHANKIPDVALHLLLSHNLWPAYSTSFSGVYWTLPIEWNFYLVFPVLLLSMSLDPRRALVFVLAAFSAVFVLKYFLFIRRESFYLLNQLPVRIEQFLIGIFFAMLFLKRTIGSRWATILFVGGLAVASYELFLPEPDLMGNFAVAVHFFMIDRIVLTVAIGCMLFAACVENAWPYRLLSARWLVFMGLISYSIYLWHSEIIHGVAWMARAVDLPLPKLLSGGIWTCIGVAMCVSIPYLSYRWIETPFLKSRDPQWQSYWRAMGTPMAVIVKAAVLILLTGTMAYKAKDFL